jgi:hypothetical protein
MQRAPRHRGYVDLRIVIAPRISPAR